MNTMLIYKWFIKILIVAIVIFFTVHSAFAQTPVTQSSVTVTATQAINFGTFCLTGNKGGTITVGWDGTRTSTGDVRLLSGTQSAKAAIFELKVCQAKNITIIFDATIDLTNNNEGSFTLDIGPTERGGNNTCFPANSDCDFITPLRVGGTLHIPGTATRGSYSGNFAISFFQE